MDTVTGMDDQHRQWRTSMHRPILDETIPGLHCAYSPADSSLLKWSGFSPLSIFRRNGRPIYGLPVRSFRPATGDPLPYPWI